MTELTPIKEEITTKDDALLWTMEQTAEKLAVSPNLLDDLSIKERLPLSKLEELYALKNNRFTTSLKLNVSTIINAWSWRLLLQEKTNATL